ncbi:RNA polymerase I-specific transcription initiation factor RRN3-like isoform X1 [Olea europaea var. sylvestris]|uniref:RNA polymerase I-specific transcription initiation factor RRN3-like isoform X1 n=1 Tax=Olea europaea var. sylvestris TaxID=158386 RepID=UPI000C1D7E80|nr:RNA polymerase I-specific transcription initiation factor RRN3-like isoform X1 [Olea europaea var. sylvestris]XP_022888474.1 RNA polymerase I-specific transcription initiation factor RRN3-like isoform X1 [Olea europaea var. sylvestris]XP_022888475.1 RNA polymerase I-specific transcription initiation factor RRN3-like isoform X1 [Olea europaea var. sylvestris]XP_022888476.1 RNA polymerase I-specific transcription initiation factor RRN3-like isoform X1 [Olea europaea var. sylvestris]XP_02288847
MGMELVTQQTVLPDMDELSFTDSELDYHVRNALKAAVQGDRDFYNQLVAVIHHKDRLVPEEVALLVTCLKALTGAVSCIHIVHHRSLLAAIFGMSLWNYGTDVMDALVELLISLAASSGQYVDLCLEMLVTNFMPPSSSSAHFIEFLKQPRGLDKKRQVLDRIHSTFQDIANLVPLTPLRLEKIIRDRMPNIYTKEPFIVMYVENMLRLESGAAGKLVGGSMLVTIMDRLIDLDVEIAWDDILQDDFCKGIFDMELEDLEGFSDQVQQDGNELTRESVIQRFFGGNLVAEKLDSLLVLTFEHLESCRESGRLIQVFETLLQSFQKTVLTAYKSKFAQFVMFYACSLDPENCGKMFTSTLVNIFVSGVYPAWRMSAVAYLASYLSRAKFVAPSFVATTLESLVKWCFDYCNNQDGDINPKAHKVFYAGCQAILYVLCFRMRSMISVPRLRSQLLLLHIEDILKHPLKPLQVCLPSIVEEFLRLAKTNQIFDVPDTFADYGMLESELSRAFGGVERLDVFFPFDPCLLRKSDRFIRPNFVYWSMVRSSYYEDEEAESASDEDIDEVGTNMADNISDDEGIAHFDEFDYSLDKMSITPRDSSAKFGGRIHGFVQMPSKIRPSTSPESL